MKSEGQLLPDHGNLPGTTSPTGASDSDVIYTRDHATIREWAAKRGAEPATGEATRSGPATVNVNDGGAGIRFNFPAASPYRSIDWEEWFENFDRHGCAFVFDNPAKEGPLSYRYRIVRAHDWEQLLR